MTRPHRRPGKLIGLLVSAGLIASFAVAGVALADETSGTDSLPEWYNEFWDCGPASGSGPTDPEETFWLQLPNPSTTLTGYVHVFFGDIEESFPGMVVDSQLKVGLIAALPVGRMEIRLAPFTSPSDKSDPVGYYTATTSFNAMVLGPGFDNSEPAQLGQPMTTHATLALSTSSSQCVEDFSESFQQGTEARFVLPEGVTAIDPVTGLEISGEITVPTQFQLGEGYSAKVQLKGYKVDVEPISVEIWKNGYQVGFAQCDDPSCFGMPVGPDPSPYLLTVYLEEGAVSPAHSLISVVDGWVGKYADGIATHLAQIVTRNEFEVPVTPSLTDLESLAVIADPAAGVTLGTRQSTVDPSVYLVPFTSTETGIKTVTGKMNGIEIPVAVADPESQLAANQALFVAGPAVAGNSRLIGTTGERVANGTAFHEATVTVRDSQNRPVAGAQVTFVADGALTALAPRSEGYVSDAEGKVTIRYVSETPGEFAVSALINDQAVEGSPVHFTFIKASEGAGQGHLPKPGTGTLANSGFGGSLLASSAAILLIAGSAALMIARRRV